MKKALKKINNYFALTAVISGINHAAVSRLKFTRSMLSKNSLKVCDLFFFLLSRSSFFFLITMNVKQK